MWDLKVLIESSLHPGDRWTQHQLRAPRAHMPPCAVEWTKMD